MSYVFALIPDTILLGDILIILSYLWDKHTHFQVNLIEYCLIFCIVTFLVFLRNKKVVILSVFWMISLEKLTTEAGTKVVQTEKGWIFYRKPEEAASQVLLGR